MTFTSTKNAESNQVPATKDCFVSWEDALKDLGDRDPEALNNFYAFDQGESTPYDLYVRLCSLDIDTNEIFFDSLLVSVENCVGQEIDDFEIEDDGFHLY
jgi:hypothetical protein